MVDNVVVVVVVVVVVLRKVVLLLLSTWQISHPHIWTHQTLHAGPVCNTRLFALSATNEPAVRTPHASESGPREVRPLHRTQKGTQGGCINKAGEFPLRQKKVPLIEASLAMKAPHLLHPKSILSCHVFRTRSTTLHHTAKNVKKRAHCVCRPSA